MTAHARALAVAHATATAMRMLQPIDLTCKRSRRVISSGLAPLYCSRKVASRETAGVRRKMTAVLRRRLRPHRCRPSQASRRLDRRLDLEGALRPGERPEAPWRRGELRRCGDVSLARATTFFASAAAPRLTSPLLSSAFCSSISRCRSKRRCSSSRCRCCSRRT